MRLLGIDYGRKKIGLALSDSTGLFPAPLVVLENRNKVIEKIVAICNKEQVEKIIIGQSINYHGRPNPIAEAIHKFGDLLADKTKLSVEYENETLTSKEAERIISRDKNYDARAAALILKSYIDRRQ